MVEISLLGEEDHSEWEALTRRYNEHFGTEISNALYDRTWRRLVARDEIRGAAARVDGAMVGLAHYYFHTSLWGAGRCYLADLFVAPGARRRGVATAILHWVARDAEKHDAPRMYWNTTLDNRDGRALYDTVADYSGFIVYNYRRDQGAGSARDGGQPETGE
ncbi:GNAT family N-acetyltransferase [Actinoplanes sp. NPDC048791]|uniref:GNAT family N-acetyltransferase n=1 Tax=Actinoplanes sp. NPDC048791 TaxID=3154623 RepID=UPI0033FE61C6